MKKFIFPLTIILFLSVSCDKKPLANDCFEQETTNVLKANKTTQSFGTIKKHNSKYVSLSFILKNSGEHIININKVDVSCSCISTKMSSQKILPKQQQELIVTIDTEKRIGYYNKAVYVNSDANNNILLLRVKGEIQE